MSFAQDCFTCAGVDAALASRPRHRCLNHCTNPVGEKAKFMRMRKKSDLPSKICAHCGLPFTWRKKWDRVWDEVKYCSERCRRATKGSAWRSCA